MWLSAITPIDREGLVSVFCGGQVNADLPPLAILLFRASDEPVEIDATAGPGACARRCAARSSRSFGAGDAVHQTASPRITDDHSRENDDDKRHPGPDADDIVPIKIAGLRRQPPSKEKHVAESSACPIARPPQVESAQNKEEKTQVCCTYDHSPTFTRGAFQPKPAMPIGHETEKFVHSRRSAPQYGSRVGVEEEASLSSENDFHRSVRRRAPAYSGGRRCFYGPRPIQQNRSRQRSGTLHRSRAIQAAHVRPALHLFLIRQQHAGTGHNQNDYCYADAKREMKPEYRFAEHELIQ